MSAQQAEIAERLLWEIETRLQCLKDLGLGYLTLMRSSPTLSGGEAQRIALSSCVGSALVGSTYVLDEPSIGLHPEDTARLIGVLERLRNQGNTVVVVEHDEDIVSAADHVVDMGPHAGSFGGEVVFSGPQDGLSSLNRDHPSLTAAYRNGFQSIPVPTSRRPVGDALTLREVRANNLQGFDATIPLRSLVAVSGVSGSGKSTLITQLLVPAIQAELDGFGGSPKGCKAIEGDLRTLEHLEFVDQNPIGKSSRSNPVTYVKAFDEIRSLLADTSHAKARGLKPSHFSFNISGGRCETCEGEGHVTVGMQFMADLKLVCEDCGGKRFQDHVLEVTYQGKNVHEILSMTVDDALLFFAPLPTPNRQRPFGGCWPSCNHFKTWAWAMWRWGKVRTPSAVVKHNASSLLRFSPAAIVKVTPCLCLTNPPQGFTCMTWPSSSIHLTPCSNRDTLLWSLNTTSTS